MKIALSCVLIVGVPNIVHATDVTNESALGNVNSIDKNVDDLNQLNRTLALERAKAELKKAKNGGKDMSSNMNGGGDSMQTIVTGVAINGMGRKIAWLQFADGGTLAVNIGSNVGEYVVSDITMTGVRLTRLTSHGHAQQKSIFLKRSYIASNKVLERTRDSRASLFSIPSPILTGANSGSDGMGDVGVTVPPITR